MSKHLVLGTPAAAYPIKDAAFPTGLDLATCKRVRLVFAYLSYPGLQALLKVPGSQSLGVEDVKTEWVVGLSHGITEPRALKTILALPNATLWLFSPDGHVSRRSLQIPPLMHGKIVAIDPDQNDRLIGIAAGSANLTGAAVGATPRNFEAGLALTHAEVALGDDRAAFDAWWDALKAKCLRGTTALIDTYANNRRAFLATRRRVIDQIDLDPPDLGDVGQAKFMWIETGDMSGGDTPRYRYQTELNQFLAGFFHAQAPQSPVSIDIELPGGHAATASLSLRTQHHFVDLWRLNLPHPRRFGLTYRHKVMRFERVAHGGATTYRIEMSPMNTRTAAGWRNAANRNGHLGRTGRPTSDDGRQWGFYT